MQKSFGPARLLTYAAVAYAAQAVVRRGYRYYRANQDNRKNDDIVDLNVEDSFPASDPPSYTRTTAGSAQ